MTALMAGRLAQPAHLSNTHLACRLTSEVPVHGVASLSGVLP
jgi:hypothetical protein